MSHTSVSKRKTRIARLIIRNPVVSLESWLRVGLTSYFLFLPPARQDGNSKSKQCLALLFGVVAGLAHT